MHYQPHSEKCVKTRELFKNILSINNYETEYINRSEISAIVPEIGSIEFYNSMTTKWGDAAKDALVVIRKCS